MHLRHPNTDTERPVDSGVYLDGTRYAVEDGVIDVAEADLGAARRWAEGYGTTVEALAVDEASDADVETSETCEVVKQDGEVCGRERPCSYHDRDD